VDTEKDSADRTNPFSELLAGTCPENDRRLLQDIRAASPPPDTSGPEATAEPPAPRDIIIVTRNIHPARPAATPNGA
jgi:hypothetical protein